MCVCLYRSGIWNFRSQTAFWWMRRAGIQKIVSREISDLFPPRTGWSEQTIRRTGSGRTMAGLKGTAVDCDNKQVAGISFGGRWHGLVILDAKDQVIRRALWNDGRIYEECDLSWTTWLGKKSFQNIRRIFPSPAFTAPKILWVKNKEARDFCPIRRSCPKELHCVRACPAYCTDVVRCFGMLIFDVRPVLVPDELDYLRIREEQLARKSTNPTRR